MIYNVKYSPLIILAIPLLMGCNNDAEIKPETSEYPSVLDSTSVGFDSNSAANSTSQYNNDSDNKAHQFLFSEYQDYSYLPKDSMIVSYGDIKDTLYGFKFGDTLVVDGDMIFNYPKQGGMKHVTGVGTTARKWKLENQKITIPYLLPTSFVDSQRVIKAFRIWSRRLPVIFKQKNKESDYIEFQSSYKTESYVGRKGGSQIVKIANSADPGSIAHEIGHVLGLFHEHTRSNRDKYIKVNELCASELNYQQAIKFDPTGRDIGDYDYFSIMHYKIDNSCIYSNGRPLPKGIPGQRDSLSRGDIKSIKFIYGF